MGLTAKKKAALVRAQKASARKRTRLAKQDAAFNKGGPKAVRRSKPKSLKSGKQA